MFSGVFGWIERSAYAAFMRGIQRGVDELTTAPLDDAPVPRLTFAGTAEEQAPAKEKRGR